ncbi:cell wall-binding repeat-containing protein, partial [Stomatohabitans albus]|uniref:cell wall-binding repeat-containing protein n=1 Tax=Stomatohabitans albus TaxID=3110766 RepID=UPI00300CA2B9
PWRQTLMVTGNIHGSEGEGTDAILAWARYLANAKGTDPIVEGASTGPTVDAFLDAYELVLVPSVNPDGRTAGTRRNAAGIDLNRDQVTRSQPETKALQALLQRFQPVMHLDLHGYYSPSGNAMGLVEPAGTPHAVAMDRALLESRMAEWLHRLDEQIINRPDVRAMGFDAKQVGVAMRDEANGRWDDWAPVYTSVWSTLMNGAGVTVESPFNPFGRPLVNGKNPAVAGNIAFHRGAMDAMALAAMDTRSELASSLINYRIQAATGTQGSSGQTWPAGWVIHAPDTQHPNVNVERLITNLVEKGVTVSYLSEDATINGKPVPKGSAFVSAKQPYRALASVTLGSGALVPGDRTTDLAAWSPGQLWGVEVDELAQGQSLPQTTATAPPVSGDADMTGPWQMVPRSLEQVRVVNTLLKRGVELYRNPKNGAIIIPAAHLNDIRADLATMNITQAGDLPDHLERVRMLRVGITSDAAHMNWLELMGFEPVYVDLLKTPEVPNNLDVLILTRHISAPAAAQVRDWVTKGGALIAIDGGQFMLTDMGFAKQNPVGLGRRSAGLITAEQSERDPVMPGRATHQVELVEPYQVWETLPDTFRAVQTIPSGSAITSGLWPSNYRTKTPMYLTIAADVGRGRVVASGAQRILRHHMLGQVDELFDWMQWVSKPTTAPTTMHTVTRVAGPDRVATSLALAAQTHPDHADTVVITQSSRWADTLVAGPLAAAHNAPIVLSGMDAISQPVLERIRSLAPKRVFLVGGEQVLSRHVVDQLRALNADLDITRLGGATRYDTSALVAATFPTTSPIVVATGDKPADALTGGVFAARKGGLTLLIPEQGAVPAAISDQVQRRPGQPLTVIGGSQAVRDESVSALTSGNRPHTRLGGQNRFETAVTIANALAPTGVIGIANGGSTADALLATPLMQAKKGVMLLTDSTQLPDSTRSAIESLNPRQVLLIGGEQVIDPTLGHEIAVLSP